MTDEKPPFEIIEDTPKKAKPKRKRYHRPLFGHIPWRWVGSAFAGGVMVVAGIILIHPPPPERVYVAVTTTPALAPFPTDTPASPSLVMEMTPIDSNTITDIAESGEWMAVADITSLRLYRNGVVYSVPDTYEPLPNVARQVALAFSPNGKQLAALSTGTVEGEGNAPLPQATLKIWDVERGDILHSFVAHEGGGWDQYADVALAYSPDGLLLATSAGGNLSWWMPRAYSFVARL